MGTLSNWVGNWSGAGRRPPAHDEASGGGLLAPGRHARTSPAPLDAIGRNHEEIRARFAEIVRKSEELIALRGEVSEMARQVGLALESSEALHSRLVEASLKLERTEQGQNAMKGRLRELQEAHEADNREILLQRAEIERSDEAVRSREKRIEQLQSEIAASREQLQRDRQEIEQLQASARQTSEELVSARMAVTVNDATIEALQKQTAAKSAEVSLAEFHVQAMQRSLAERQDEVKCLHEAVGASETRIGALTAELGATKAELASARQRIETLTATLSVERLEHTAASQQWRQRVAKQNHEIDALKETVDTLTARANSAEEQLLEARADIVARTAEQRLAERRAQDAEARVAPLDERNKGAMQEIAKLNEAVSDLTSSRARLANRSQTLVRVMKDQKAKLENSGRHVRLLEERLAADQAHFNRVAEDFRGTIEDLTARLEKEKLAHQLASAALEIARVRSGQIEDAPGKLGPPKSAERSAQTDEEAPSTAPNPRVQAFLPAGLEVRPPSELADSPLPPAPKPRPSGPKREVSTSRRAAR